MGFRERADDLQIKGFHWRLDWMYLSPFSGFWPIICTKNQGVSVLWAIPTRSPCPQATDRRVTAVAGQLVGGEISNMLDISQWSQSSGDRRPVGHFTCHTHRVIGARIGVNLAPITPKLSGGYGPLRCGFTFKVCYNMTVPRGGLIILKNKEGWVLN